MSDVVVDSSVVAKWILPEDDSALAHQVIADTSQRGDRLVILDLAFIEVANVIWKRQRQGLASADDARSSLAALTQLAVHVEPARPLLAPAPEVAIKYDRAVYDALFVALAQQSNATGVTADEPLHRAVHGDIPSIILLRDW